MTLVGIESSSERYGGEAFALHLSQRIKHKPAVLSLTDEGKVWIIETFATKITRSHRERAEFRPK